jgi:predicted HTH transcriptional regulator
MDNIFQKNFDDITGDDIQNLIAIKHEERQTMEYKGEMYGKNDEEKREMLKDIASFSNAYGGYLILGVVADANGKPQSIVNIENAEKEKDRLDKICMSNIEL